MALVLIDGPDNAPSTAADWDKVNDVLQTIGLDISKPTRIKDGYIHRGSVLFFAGAWYVADSDTEITGVASDYVKLVNTAGVVTAEYVSELVDVTFNRTWNGWYDPDGNMFIFDEVKAFGIGDTTELGSLRNWFPSLAWSRALSRVLSATNLARLFRLDEEVILTGSGTWTVPSGVFFIEADIIGPGANGGSGSTYGAGIGGASGEEKKVRMTVTPGDTIPYAITYTSTVFGTTTALKGAGRLGGKGGPSNPGGNGGGYKGGIGGGFQEDGGDATDGYGGGGGGGGYSIGSPGPIQSGGRGALGTVRIR